MNLNRWIYNIWNIPDGEKLRCGGNLDRGDFPENPWCFIKGS